MALREELERAGNWLFRRRSLLPVLLAPLLLVAMWEHHVPADDPRFDTMWELACFAAALVGLAVRAITLAYAAPGTSGPNRAEQVAETLNTTGPYSVVRHPLYLGNYIMWLSLSAVPRVWWLPLLVTLTFWLYYERIMFAEEAFLRRRFGEAFIQWAAVTPAVVPRWSLWRAPARRFSFRAVLRQEYSALLVLLACFAVLDAAGDLASRGRLLLDDLWPAALAGAVALSVALRTLRRHTRLLDVADR